MTRSYSIHAINPTNPEGGKAEILIPGDLALHWYKYYPVTFQNLEAAREVLENPKRIFSGLRSLTEGGWCYTGRPKQWCVAENVFAPLPPKLVYAVYINQRMYLYNHRSEEVDPDDVNSPKNWKDRFGGLVWRSTS